MSRVRFLADHNLNEHIIIGVLRREPKLEFVRARQRGMSTTADAAILDYAAREGLIVVSHDVNTMPAEAYARIEADQPLSGLIMVRQDDPIGVIIEDLILIWSASESEEWRDQVFFLPLSRPS